ncbi:acyl-CoA thioesterase [Roseococcus sp. SYP-B2431]|uniref:acyl-CoA thioesterase n=1 Tax=Roseococcus sp. SYP-B2431 TaxID=2496640 RepID=UPI00103FC879|nr:thioesterase family protein [Roseococcus sp. SYP-B2431]TCH99685.1 acyl-CoA thioesterase [Roseococcus sp. SYP-B2431]
MASLMEEFGVEGEWSMAVRHRIRWAECDLYGHVNHTAYLVMFEDLRVDHWRSLGQALRADQPGPVVAKLEARYLRALAFEDEVLLTLRVAGLRNTSFTQDYAVWRKGLCFECRALLVCVRDGASTPIPPEARRLMIERDGAKAEGIRPA